MSRINKLFENLKSKNEKALVGFISGGDPDFDKSLEIVKTMCTSGLDILELGIPFSDPTADGPLIQRSSARALKSGITLPKVLDMTKEIRKDSDIPIILFSYYNPVHAYGVEKFYNDACMAGADGVLIVDLPPEESDEMTSCWGDNDFSLISLVAPTTPQSRMNKITDTGSGFVYLVSKTGVTGSGGIDTTDVAKHAELLRGVTDLPVCVGFGISTADHVREIAKIADGIVIGSAFEKLIEDNIDNSELVSIIEERVKEYKKATLL